MKKQKIVTTENVDILKLTIRFSCVVIIFISQTSSVGMHISSIVKYCQHSEKINFKAVLQPLRTMSKLVDTSKRQVADRLKTCPFLMDKLMT